MKRTKFLLLILCSILLLPQGFSEITIDFPDGNFSGNPYLLDFDSPYSNASGNLNLHMTIGNPLNLSTILIQIRNNDYGNEDATILIESSYGGEQIVNIPIPSGAIADGSNTLKIDITGVASIVHGDSNTLIQEQPEPTGTTLEPNQAKTICGGSITDYNFNSPYQNADATLNLHAYGYSPNDVYYGWWRNLIYINDILVANAIPIGEGKIQMHLGSGAITQGTNKITFQPQAACITIFRDTNMAIQEQPEPTGTTLEPFKAKTGNYAVDYNFFSAQANTEAVLNLHAYAINYFGSPSWPDFFLYVNDILVGDTNALVEEEQRALNIPAGLITKGINKILFYQSNTIISIFRDTTLNFGHCGNGVQDSDETDIDCGGNCLECDDRKDCLTNSDCISNYCNPNGKCDVQRDLYIEWIKPIQVVEDVPLVAGKATVVRVKVVNNGPETNADISLNYGECPQTPQTVHIPAFSSHIANFYPNSECTHT